MGKIVTYTSEELKKLPSESNWDAAARMTDAEIEAADADDAEVAGIDETWLEEAEVVFPELPQRKGIFAVYDEYVIEFFKKQGRGYQTRMNAVLKAYVDAQLAKQSRSD